MSKKTRGWLVVLTALLVIALIILAGPRVSTKAEISETDLPPDLTEYLSEKELEFDDLVPGTEKKIVWNGSPNERTEVSLVFLHSPEATEEFVTAIIDFVQNTVLSRS